MSHDVLLTRDAVRDLEAIHDFLTDRSGATEADAFLDRIQGSIAHLSDIPERGSYPPELLDLGIRSYRQIHAGKVRILYRVTEEVVYIYMIADGRRDLRSLLHRRLLEP